MMWEKIRFLFYALLFVGGIFISILGHRIEGIRGVLVMLLGPFLHLLLLYLYNRKYR